MRQHSLTNGLSSACHVISLVPICTGKCSLARCVKKLYFLTEEENVSGQLSFGYFSLATERAYLSRTAKLCFGFSSFSRQ